MLIVQTITCPYYFVSLSSSGLRWEAFSHGGGELKAQMRQWFRYSNVHSTRWNLCRLIIDCKWAALYLILLEHGLSLPKYNKSNIFDSLLAMFYNQGKSGHSSGTGHITFKFRDCAVHLEVGNNCCLVVYHLSSISIGRMFFPL